MDDEDQIVYNKQKPFFFIRWYKKLIVWWKIRQLAKDDPFIYEDE